MQKLTGFVPARDGVNLAFDAKLPGGASVAAPVPAVVTRTRRTSGGASTMTRHRPGLGSSRPDTRTWVSTYAVAEMQDWCTGKVGMFCLSYDAITQ